MLVSPFGMALAAATVAAGQTPVPRLIAGRETEISGDRQPIPANVVDNLRPMMRLVVTNGTAKDLQERATYAARPARPSSPAARTPGSPAIAVTWPSRP